jgi:hypothetical protein
VNQISNSSRFFVALTGALIVVGATWKVRHPNDATRIASSNASRSVASLRADPKKKARFDEHGSKAPEGKVSGTFEVLISADETATAAVRSPSQVKLRGRITADRHLAAQDFSWILPTSYKVVEGLLIGTIPELQPGQVHEISLTVDRGSEPAQPIVLHVFKLINSEPRGQVAQFNFPEATAKSKAGGTEKAAAPIRDYVQ